MKSTTAKAWRYRTYRPRLPEAAVLLPYLQEIDRNSWYSNFGPLVRRLEERLAAHYGMDEGQVVTVANCTSGLALALQSLTDARSGDVGERYCALPSWTFVGTAAAVRQAGLTPWFLDVERENWQLTPQIVEAALAQAPGMLAAVMPVAPFGDRADAAAWAAFRRRHGVPVVLDAAAGFDTVTKENAPAVISLHATKPLGIGEGGVVLAESPEQAENIRRRSNFGFDRHHAAAWSGCNAKLSEYQAAVGLAALDAWPQTRALFADSADRYRAVLAAEIDGVIPAPCFARCAVNTGCHVIVEGPPAPAVVSELRARGIEARQWWDQGCHHQPAYAGCKRTALPVTEFLADRALALPYHAEISQNAIGDIVDALRDVITQLTK